MAERPDPPPDRRPPDWREFAMSVAANALGTLLATGIVVTYAKAAGLLRGVRWNQVAIPWVGVIALLAMFVIPFIPSSWFDPHRLRRRAKRR